MSNYQRCKIRVYPKAGRCSPEELRPRVELLQRLGGIYETIHLYPGDGQRHLEIRFTAKHYPLMLDDVFPTADFDLWVIKSDEGGGADRIQLLSGDGDFSSAFEHKALYRFDAMVLVGAIPIGGEELQRVFGYGAADLGAGPAGPRCAIAAGGLYTGNGFFYGEEGGEIVLCSHEPTELSAPHGELWDVVFHAHGVEFMERFYLPVLRAPAGERRFAWLERVDLTYAGRLARRIEQRQRESGWRWERPSADGFWNLANPEWCAYRPPGER